MNHKCYISFKTEDIAFKNYILEELEIDMIDKSLNNPINSNNEDYIMQIIRKNYLSDSTVTIFLIGSYSSERRGSYEQRFIKRELQASLYNGKNNTRNGILGIVLPHMESQIYKGSNYCYNCREKHYTVIIDDSTVIKEFSYNYYLPNENCAYWEDDRYCVLVKWEDFCDNPNKYIDIAYNKRFKQIANKVKVYGT